MEVADQAVEDLLEEGWPQEHVCLLTTGARHPVQVERAAGDDQEGYWRTFWDTEDVFYGHVLGCKGLERRVVVLCVNDDGTLEMVARAAVRRDVASHGPAGGRRRS